MLKEVEYAALLHPTRYMRLRRREPTPLLDEAGGAVDALAGAQVGEQERTLSPHAGGVALHDVEGGADVGRKVDLVDDQQVGTGDAGAALGRDLVAGRNV